MSARDSAFAATYVIVATCAGMFGTWKLVIAVAALFTVISVLNYGSELLFAPDDGGGSRARWQFVAALSALLFGFVGNEIGWTNAFAMLRLEFLRP